MPELLLSIALSACLPLLLKAFAGWQVSVALAVPTNYVVCVGLGTLLGANPAAWAMGRLPPWSAAALVQGLLLAGNFYLLAFAAQRAGVALATLASRLSVAVPVALALGLYGDPLRGVNAVGLGAALVALICASEVWPPPHDRGARRWGWLSGVVFVCFGGHFSLLKHVQQHYLTPAQHHDYLTSAFTCALALSLLVLMVRGLPRDGQQRLRSILGGALLGLCNYGALLFLTRVLADGAWSSAVIFPTYSVGVVVLSTLGAVVLLAERISTGRMVGILIGLGAVVLLNL